MYIVTAVVYMKYCILSRVHPLSSYFEEFHLHTIFIVLYTKDLPIYIAMQHNYGSKCGSIVVETAFLRDILALRFLQNYNEYSFMCAI